MNISPHLVLISASGILRPRDCLPAFDLTEAPIHSVATHPFTQYHPPLIVEQRLYAPVILSSSIFLLSPLPSPCIYYPPLPLCNKPNPLCFTCTSIQNPPVQKIEREKKKVTRPADTFLRKAGNTLKELLKSISVPRISKDTGKKTRGYVPQKR